MKLLLLTPTFAPQLTGNAVTVFRIAHLLAEAGVNCRVVDLSTARAGEPLAVALQFKPDIIHAFHALKGGRCGLALQRQLGVPLVVSITGTDLYVEMADVENRGLILEVLAAAVRIVTFDRRARAALRRAGVPGEKIAVVHQSVLLPEGNGPDYRLLLGIEREVPVILMLGGVRRVKNIPAALSAVEQVRMRLPALRLLIAGPIIEAEEFARISAWCRMKEWVSLLGAVPRENVPALLDAADILLNCSHSESESNAILEALSRGKIVIARDIPGNASLLAGGVGSLFRSDAELPEKIAAVLENRAAWEAAARAARLWTAGRFAPTRERAGYLAVYEACLAAMDRSKVEQEQRHDDDTGAEGYKNGVARGDHAPLPGTETGVGG